MAALAMCSLVVAAASPLLEGAKLVCGPIYRATSSFFKLQSNLNDLDKKMQDLAHLSEELKQQVEEAEKSGRGAATHQARKWQRQVEKVKAKAEEIMLVAGLRVQPANSSTRLVSGGRFLRCHLSRKVGKTLKEVQRLLSNEAYPTQLVAMNLPPQTVEHIPATSVEGQTTASWNMTKIMELLNRDEIQLVGVWGMGGVGKTTLVKNLNNKLNQSSSVQPFGMVIWATVSKDFNLKRVQTQIAERLNMTVGESNEDRMAIRLHERLRREEKFLLILDDVWQPIDLDLLGIPQPQALRGGKILLTSRSLRVCVQMKTDEQVKIEALDDDEAWRLFSSTVGGVAKLEQIKPIAIEVSKQCSGLPLAIVIVGAAMRGKDMIELWNDALSELQRSLPTVEDVEEEVFKPLKWSYDKLQGNTIKSCFLYCCLYPEDFSIRVSELVKCWVGEGLIDEKLNYECLVNRGNALIQTLKDVCLLEIGEQQGTVKMHDVVRDVGIWISSSSENRCKSLVKAGIGLTEVSEVEFSKDLKRVSLMNNKINRLPCDTNQIECSNASTLFLQGNGSLKEVSDGFLLGFGAVRVLNLSYTNLSSLPPSVMQLANLRSLILRYCNNLNELPSSGWEGLKRTHVLDLSHTGIRELPRGIGKLIKLRELHLFSTKGLVSIPAGVFSMLSSLEVLEMEGSKYVWGMKGDVDDGEANLEELESLNRMQVLSIGLKRKTTLSSTLNLSWISRLTTFRLLISLVSTWSIFDGATRQIIIKGINLPEEERIEYLLTCTTATSLKLDDCGGLDQMLQNMALNSTSARFSALKSLTIRGSNYSFGPAVGGFGAQCDLLPNLEQLNLHHLQHMESISGLVGLLGLRLSKLRSVVVSNCEAMKYLLTVGHGDGLILENLQDIKVWNCMEMEELFQCATNVVVSVPNLRKINLIHVPKLRTLCKQSGPWPCLEKIEVRGCGQLRKLPLSSQNAANRIKEIRGDELWWSQLEWDNPRIKNSLHHVFKP